MAGMTDPWGDEKVIDAEPSSVTTEIVGEPALSCPHCGTTLTPHFDAVGSLHCHDPQCAGCCFFPPDEGHAEPQLKPELAMRLRCKMAQRVASAF